MHVFKHAQPALLYMVPLCLLTPLVVALLQGDLKKMFSYRDHEESTGDGGVAGSSSSVNTSNNSENDSESDKTSGTSSKEAKKIK